MISGRSRGTPQARQGRAAGRAQSGYDVSYDSGGEHENWADLREDKIDPAPGFWPMLGPLGPPAGTGSGNGPGSKNKAGCTKNQPRRPIISPIRWHFAFWGPTAKDKR